MKTISNNQLLSTWKRKYPYYLPMLGALRGEDHATRKFWSLGTACCKPIPERDQKYGYREPHDADAVAEHAFWVLSILHAVQVKGIFAQLVRPEVSWFGPRHFKHLNVSRHDYLNSVFESATKERFCEALEFDRIPTRFINLFVDFPYANRCYDIELLCRPQPIVVTFSHHLTVDFDTPQFSLFRQIKTFFRSTNLRMIETLSPRKAREQSRQLDALFRHMGFGGGASSKSKNEEVQDVLAKGCGQ
jgi:hypothetical protein